MKKLLIALALVVVVGCGIYTSRVSTLDSASGGMAAAYYGKLDDLLLDLRTILIRETPKYSLSDPQFVDEGSVKGYTLDSGVIIKHKFMFIPVRGITDKGREVDAYALEIFAVYTRHDDAVRWYKKLKPEFDAKYALVRAK